jgi:hypothetical protein
LTVDRAEKEGRLRRLVGERIAEGMPIDRGRVVVVVVKARGNRVLVRAVEA